MATDYRASDAGGAYCAVLLRNDGGSIAHDVEVVLLLDRDELSRAVKSVAAEGEERVRLAVPPDRCEFVPQKGHRAVGELRFEARYNGKVAATLDMDPA